MIRIHEQIQFVAQTTPTRPAFALTILNLLKKILYICQGLLHQTRLQGMEPLDWSGLLREPII